MGSFFNSVSAVIVVMAITAVGYFMGRAGWMNASHKPMLVKLLINISVPAMSIYNIQQNFTRDMLSGALVAFVAPFLGIVAVILLSVGITRLLKLPRQKAGVFMAMACFSNSIFIGYPMCLELFGEKCVPYVMWYYLANTTLFQSVGIGMLEHAGGGGGGVSFKSLLHVVKMPPFIAMAASIILLLLDIRLPHVAMSFAKYLGSIVSPVGLIYSGFVMYEIGFKNLRLEKGLPLMMLLRFALSPLCCVLLCRAFGISALPLSVFAVEASMPVMTQVVVLTGAFGADEQYAAKGAVLSIIASFVAIPVLMAIV